MSPPSRPPISVHLRGHVGGGDLAVVEVLVHRLRRKIDPPGGRPVIATVRGEGYLIQDDAS